MKVIIFILILISYSINAFAFRVTLKWDANAEGDLAGYRLYYRTFDGEYNFDVPSWDGNNITCEVILSDPGCFVVIAYDTSNNVSEVSNEVCAFEYDLDNDSDVDGKDLHLLIGSDVKEVLTNFSKEFGRR